MSLKFHKNFIVATAVALAVFGLAGCGGVDDIQLNGKIFDAVGMTGSAPKKTPQLAERSPLVVPPGLEKLPEPGSGGAGPAEIAGVSDHDAKRHQGRNGTPASPASATTTPIRDLLQDKPAASLYKRFKAPNASALLPHKSVSAGRGQHR